MCIGYVLCVHIKGVFICGKRNGVRYIIMYIFYIVHMDIYLCVHEYTMQFVMKEKIYVVVCLLFFLYN